MKHVDALRVTYHDRLVGTLAENAAHRIAFAYEESWLKEGFSISPFSLPLRREVFVPRKDTFDGLFGVFADSLPDAWGRLLLHRMLREHEGDSAEISTLDRLAIVGSSGMGALEYRPAREMQTLSSTDDLDLLANQCQRILKAEYTEQLDALYAMGGTSGGARPKVLMEIDGEDWLIKFPAHIDSEDAGKMEYDYACCARACGIEMTAVRLFPSKRCAGYFGTKRFDRRQSTQGRERIHMLTAAALLETDFTQPSLDYHSLMKLTKILTRDDNEAVENMYRRMCFNVYAHNRDDHAKNFSFLYDDGTDAWHLAPAYDLTYSNTYYGEHTTSVDGNGRNPGEKELVKVGVGAGLTKAKCIQIARDIRDATGNMLQQYIKDKDNSMP